MTVKQFAYLAVGGIFAVVAFHVPNPSNSFFITAVKYTLVPLFGLTGAAFAFMPLEGRPLDTMVSNFVKALFKPNQFVYVKTGGNLAFLHASSQIQQAIQAQSASVLAGTSAPVHDPLREQKLQALLNQIHTRASPVARTEADQKEQQYLQSLFGSAPGTIQRPSTSSGQGPASQGTGQYPASPPTPVSSALHTTLSAIAPIAAPKLPPPPLTQPPTPSPAQTTTAQTPLPPLTPPSSAAPDAATDITPDMARALGLPHLPDTPNLIIGIIKDARGNVLSGILVDVKDKDGNPIRAFKTNVLGQFVSATPLANGTYTVDFEDPKGQNKFTSISLTADGTILQPIIVISVDAREELRKELFG